MPRPNRTPPKPKIKLRSRPRLRAASAPEARAILHDISKTKNGEQTAKVEKVLRKHGKARLSLRQVGELNIGKYRLFPAQPKERQKALAASIDRHGIIIPVVADEQGNVIAGEFSYEYAKEHDVRCSVLIIRFACEAEKWELALALNPPTRQLDRGERESLIETYLRKDPQIAPKNLADLIGGTSKNKVADVQEKLIADGTIPRFEKLRGHDGRYRPGTLRPGIIANSPNEIKAALEAIPALPDGHGKIIDIITAKRHARCHAKRQDFANKVIAPLPDDAIQLHHCRFQDLDIEAESAHLVCTDFPYTKDFLPQLPELAAFAERILRPSGLLVTYAGQYFLDHAVVAFRERLTWRWQISLAWEGHGKTVHSIQAINRWRPVLVYSKGGWNKRRRWLDCLCVDSHEKLFHKWQQPLKEVESLVSFFSEPGELVVDPCGGSFTTAVACRNLGRRFVGCDIDANAVGAGCQRLADTTPHEAHKERKR